MLRKVSIPAHLVRPFATPIWLLAIVFTHIILARLIRGELIEIPVACNLL